LVPAHDKEFLSLISVKYLIILSTLLAHLSFLHYFSSIKEPTLEVFTLHGNPDYYHFDISYFTCVCGRDFGLVEYLFLLKGAF
jgi:hypothetical protein